MDSAKVLIYLTILPFYSDAIPDRGPRDGFNKSCAVVQVTACPPLFIWSISLVTPFPQTVRPSASKIPDRGLPSTVFRVLWLSATPWVGKLVGFGVKRSWFQFFILLLTFVKLLKLYDLHICLPHRAVRKI